MTQAESADHHTMTQAESADQLAVGPNGQLLNASKIAWYNDPDDPHPIQSTSKVQWVKKLSQCLAVLERLTWHKSSKLHNNLKLIYVILGHLSFQINLISCDLKQN